MAVSKIWKVKVRLKAVIDYATNPEKTRAQEYLMFYQLYNIHLLNGEVVQSAEDYDLPAEKGLVGIFERMKETDILTVNDLLLGSAYIPKCSIVYIATGDVVEGHKYGS